MSFSRYQNFNAALFVRLNAPSMVLVCLQIVRARHVHYFEHENFTGIANTPSRFASSRKNIYTVVSGKPANDLQTNMCNSTVLVPGPVVGTVSAFQTCSQTQRNYPITFTLCSRDCSRFPNFTKYHHEVKPPFPQKRL